MIPFEKAKKYFQLAEFIANTFSKDQSTKVGCVFLNKDTLHILSTGYNGMPRGIDETILDRWDRPDKYLWVEHAERNAIYNASLNGVNLSNSIVIVTMFPCADCMRGIIQVGAKYLCTRKPSCDQERWTKHFDISYQMIKEANIQLFFIEDL